MNEHNNKTIAVMHFGGNFLRGTEVCLIHTIDGLDAAGYKVILIANQPDVIVSRLKNPPYKLLQSKFPEIMIDRKISFPLLRYVKKIRELTHFLKQEQPSLILTSGGLPCQMGLPISKILGIPIAVHLHHPAAKRYFYFWMIPWANLIIAPSKHTHAVINQKCKIDAAIVYNGIDVDEAFFPATREMSLRNSLNISQHAVVISTVCALIPHKRVDLFLRAFAIAKPKSHHQLHGLVIGKGPEKEKLNQLAVELGIADAITFIERVPEIPPYHQQVTDIHLLASDEEGFGLSVAEAAACGLPNIVSASGALVEIVQDGVDGIQVHGDSAEHFAQAILQLTESSELRSRMGQAGRQQAVDRFSVTAYKKNMLQQLESLLTGK